MMRTTNCLLTSHAIAIYTNSKPDYRVGLEAELKALRESEMWRAGETVRKLRPENN